MSLSLDNNKRSSRQGRYRHQLVTGDFFVKHAHSLSAFFGVLQKKLLDRQCSSADFVGYSLLALLSCRRNDAFQKHASLSSELRSSHLELSEFNCSALLDLMRQQSLPTKALESLAIKDAESLLSLIAKIRFRGIPESARLALLAWMQGNYPLQLFFRIPLPQEIFEMQKQGLRCVSILISELEMQQLYHGRDALSFIVHDLIHAHEFYSNPQRARQQIGFYHWVSEVHHLPYLQEILRTYPEFQKKWEYLLSDMNSYCGHLLKTTHAFLQIQNQTSNSSISFEHLWKEIVAQTNLNLNQQKLFQRINQQTWNDTDFLALETVFERYAQNQIIFSSLPQIPPTADKGCTHQKIQVGEKCSDNPNL